MSLTERVRPYLPDQIRTLPLDLAVLLLSIVITAGSVSIPFVRETPLRAIVSLPFLLFVPGYAFVAAMYPEGPVESSESETVPQRGLSNLERLAFSLGASVATVPLVGFTLNFTPWGLRLEPLLVALSLFTVVCVLVANKRRRELSVERQFEPPVDRWIQEFRREFLSSETRSDRLLNIAMLVVLLFAMTSVGYAFVDQRSGAEYTELYLLTRTGDGSLVANDYPTELTATESRTIVVGVGNHEQERTSYTVVTELQRIESTGGSATVAESERLDEFTVTLSPSEVSRQTRVLEPTIVGEQMRLVFLLYRGGAPADPQLDTAYRSTHLSVNVSSVS